MSRDVFSALHIGASHEKSGLPCQDACLSEKNERYELAIVSDGHGSRRHFRSEKGSQLACKIAARCIRELLEGLETMPTGDQLQALKENICRDWRAAIMTDAAQNPWTDAEMEEQRQILDEQQLRRLQSGETAAYAYGCTLCAVFAARWGWGAVQVGDGSLAVIDRGGAYRWPMPESRINSGHSTASLCSPNPMEDFRHVTEEGTPAGLMVYTDGIEKVFPEQGPEVARLLHWVWRNQRFGGQGSIGALTQALGEVTRSSPIGDDAAIAGILDMDAQDAEPDLGPALIRRQLRAALARREEILAAIRYNQAQLAELRRTDPDSGAVQQIGDILRRREADWMSLTRDINAKRIQLGLPEDDAQLPAMPAVQEEPEQEDEPEQEESEQEEPAPEKHPVSARRTTEIPPREESIPLLEVKERISPLEGLSRMLGRAARKIKDLRDR